MLTLRLENPAAPGPVRGHSVTNCGLKEAPPSRWRLRAGRHNYWKTSYRHREMATALHHKKAAFSS